MLALLFALGGLLTSTRRKGTAAAPVVWTEDEMRTFVRHVQPLGVPLEAALAVYTAESGLNPKASSGIAWGIAQIIGTTLRGIGWTRPAKDFGTLSITEQIPWVAKLLAAQIRGIGYVPKSALELYVANFSPAAAKERAEIIYRRGSQAYAKNEALDHDKKGYIDQADLAVSIRRAEASETYKRAIAQLEKVSHGG
jgi:hypothetical protein